MTTGTLRFRFTTDEYERMIATGILTEEDRVELVDGEIIAMTPIGDEHVFALNSLTAQLFQKLAGRAVISVQNPIRLSDFSRPQPDIALWRLSSRRTLAGPADILLLVEISDSTLSFDRDVKLPLYARAAIQEVWIVNLVEGQIEVYRGPVSGEYQSAETFVSGDQISPQAFGDAAFAVDDILS